MTRLIDILKQKKHLLADGAWGTMLQAAGLQSGECPELWNLERREDVLRIAKAYANLGIDLIGTNSFGGSRFKLESFGLQNRVYEINKAAAEISNEAIIPGQMVIGSIGPTGKILLMGDVTEDELYQAFAEQAMALRDGGADIIIIETMSALDESLAAIRAVKDNTDLEIISSFTFEKTATGEFRTMMGASPVEMVSAAIKAGVSAVGTNCGNGLENMITIVEEIHSNFPDVPILVNANAGIPHLHKGETVFPESPDEMAGYVPKVIHAGATIVGGCCGTTPDHIVKIKEVVLRANS